MTTTDATSPVASPPPDSWAGTPSLGNVDGERLQRFAQRVLSDMSGAMVSLMGVLGDRLGLFGALAASGPVSARELAERASIDERYADGWLNALACAGYVERQRAGGELRYALAPEHALVLAVEGTPLFLGAAYQQLAGFAGALDAVCTDFATAAGVPQEQYRADMHVGMERMSASWFDNLLVSQWIAGLPDVRRRLAAGCRVADLGCGCGRALTALAQEFPHSIFDGYDVFGPALARAREGARAAGLADRIRFVQRDVSEGLEGTYDLVTTFHLLHDARDPLKLASGVRRALAADGTWLVLESNGAEDAAADDGPAATILYATSVLFCLPTAIASGAPGLGTMGLPEPRLRELCSKAGFSQVRRLAGESPFNALYEVKC
ncbi:MAG TPA: methyltransferase [Solirubrobacteraceae bacterium]|nr:methyltransferase [Solirubrobacteraceae bacterium]